MEIETHPESRCQAPSKMVLIFMPTLSEIGTERENGIRDDKKKPDTKQKSQLGLRLVSAKTPIDFVLVDHIERPSANEGVQHAFLASRRESYVPFVNQMQLYCVRSGCTRARQGGLS